MNILEIKGLIKVFGDKEVLHGIDLAIPEHSIFGFIGPNGAGKTTTMKAILGLLKPDSGEIYVNSEKVFFGQTPTNKYIGYLPDVPEFYDFMTAAEYLDFCGRITGLSKTERTKRTGELLELVGLKDQHHRIKGFSRGMKQRLGIAQALYNKPKLLLCDEPTSALDPIGRKEILDILQAACKETTILFSTHILADVERICTDVAVLYDGQIALKGKLDALTSARKADVFEIQLADGRILETCEEQLPQLLRQMADENWPLQKIQRKEPTLENLFLEVTKC